MKRASRPSFLPVPVWFGVGLVLLTMPVSLVAGEPPVVSTGSVVRFSAPSIDRHRISGSVVSADEHVLEVAVAGGQRVSVPRDGITKLEVKTGRKSHWAVGLGVGAAAGLALAIAGGCNDCLGATQGELAVRTTPILGAVGAAIGLLIRTDRWEPAAPHQLHVSLGLPARKGVGLSVVMSF